jgi:hypothetical protein
MQYDVWAVTPSTNDALFSSAASIAGAGVIPLITYTVGANGTGYKLVFTSSGDDSGITFTVVGNRVGDVSGDSTTEVVTGANATTASTTNFYTNIISITASGASAGTVKIGTVGSLALPRCRIKGLYWVASATAGTIKVNRNSTTGLLLLQINTPALATAVNSLYMAAEGILTTKSTLNDFAIVTLTDVTAATLICG